jgi:hypothetical protein
MGRYIYIHVACIAISIDGGWEQQLKLIHIVQHPWSFVNDLTSIYYSHQRLQIA